VKWDKEPWSNVQLRRRGLDGHRPGFPAEKVCSNRPDPALTAWCLPAIEGYTPRPRRICDDGPDRSRRGSRADTQHELGYGPDKPLNLEIRFNTSENHQNTAVAIQEQLKPLGINVTLVNTDTKTHYGHLEQKGDFDYARAGWIADYKDPESFLGISRAASGSNYSNYNSPKYEELMDKAAAAGGNPDERFKLLAEAEKVLVDDLGNMPLLFYSYHNLVSPKLTGYEQNVMDVHPSRFIGKEG
jgi:oligopeptide transport system substrate-binding protein